MIRFLEAKNQFNIDYDLRKLAIENLEKKANENEYMNKRLVTKNGGVAIPRWASDLELVKHIGKTQQKDINPDAIFGQIDPRDSNNVKLNEMFKDQKQTGDFLRLLNKPRGSSAKQWNDTMEFATPNIQAKEGK